jgi:hypothetical protein
MRATILNRSACIGIGRLQLHRAAAISSSSRFGFSYENRVSYEELRSIGAKWNRERVTSAAFLARSSRAAAEWKYNGLEKSGMDVQASHRHSRLAIGPPRLSSRRRLPRIGSTKASAESGFFSRRPDKVPEGHPAAGRGASPVELLQFVEPALLAARRRASTKEQIPSGPGLASSGSSRHSSPLRATVESLRHKFFRG